MTEAKTYNGWTNYETWAVKLWIDNDEGSYRYWDQLAQECYDDSSDKEEAVRALADRLKDEHEEANPVPDGTIFSDLMSAALGEVNWHEIAENLLEEVEEKEPEPDDED